MNVRYHCWLSLLICFLFPVAGFGQSSYEYILSITENDAEFEEKKYNLAPYLYVLPDSTGLWTIEDVQSEAFQIKFQIDSLNLLGIFGSDMGPEIKAIWARITIQSELDFPLNWLINFSAGKVDLYIPGDVGNYTHKPSGIYLPMQDRFDQGKFGYIPCLPLAIPAESTQTIYLKITCTGLIVKNGLLQEFNQSLFSPEVYSDFDRKFRSFNFLILGILLAVAFYHLMIFFFNQKPVFLFFSLFVLGYTMLYAAFSGYFAEFIIPERDKTLGIVYLGIGWIIVYIFFYLFSRTYLRVKQLLPVWDKIWAGLVVTRILLIIVKQSTVISAGSLENTDKNSFFLLLLILEVVHMLFLLTAIYIAVRSLKKGNKPAGIYLVAMAAFFIEELVSSEIQFFEITYLPNYLNLGGIGIAVTVLLFSIAIAGYIKSLEKEKTAAEQSQIMLQAEANQIKAIDQFKTRFYTNITHEFRTPLTIILGMADQVKNYPGKWFDQGLKMINRNGRKLLNLINQMLDLSKLEANTMPVDLIQDDIVPFLKYLVESFESLAGAKHIRFDISIEPESIRMDFDPDKIQNILSNLLSNAIKFTPRKGRVSVSVFKEQTNQGNFLVLSVKDTGAGIPAEDLPNVFDRYFQADQNDQHLVEGTGLGLALTRELVKLLKGDITVASPKQGGSGNGTVFTIRLPITNLAPERQDFFKGAEKPTELSSRKSVLGVLSIEEEDGKLELLIVEDNDDVVEYLRSILSEDYKIEVAKNGQEGFKKATDRIPNLVISDIVMPVMDGFSFCEKLKADIRTSHIPVILLTARADAESKMKGLTAGADVYLAKPFDKKELLISIQKLITLRKALQERYQAIGTFSGSIEIAGNNAYKMEDTFIHKVRQTLDEHISEEEFGIIELCHSMSMSRSQLYRKFKVLTNTTVHHFIRKLRLAKAKELLLTTELNVTEVAMETGFRNLSHFSKLFSEEFGITPSHVTKKI